MPGLIGFGELKDGGEKNAIEFELGLGVQVRAPQTPGGGG